MKLWLDDIREPWMFGCPGCQWVKTAEEAVTQFKTGTIFEASLDHDLTDQQMAGGILGEVREDGQKSGYDVVLWLEEHPEYWPICGVKVHSGNPAGTARMEQVIRKFYTSEEGKEKLELGRKWVNNEYPFDYASATCGYCLPAHAAGLCHDEEHNSFFAETRTAKLNTLPSKDNIAVFEEFREKFDHFY